jgi:hypothetical protein
MLMIMTKLELVWTNKSWNLGASFFNNAAAMGVFF